MKNHDSGKTLVLGYFGYRTNQLDGQTIKTRNVYEMLRLAPYCDEVGFFDTESFKESKWNILNMFLTVWKAQKLIYIPAHNNLKFFFPLIFLLTKIKRIPIAYVVVGGWLADFIKTKKLLTKLLAKVDIILPQTEDLTERLQTEYGFKNVMTFPNFRIHDFEPHETEVTNRNLRLVFMARVRKMKGVDVVFETIRAMKLKYGKVLSIDFYGPVFEEDREYFEAQIEAIDEATYKGELDPSVIYKTLSNYDILVLPTKYFTEGFPGSVLDAYISGIPVIVSDWKYAKEFVEHEVSGLIFKWDNQSDFALQLERVHLDRELLQNMKTGARRHSKKYSVNKAMNLLESFFTDKSN
ncbi:glycosyltransferase [Owenweeksia hongkongensis DSM 17368]|uniref:Glycosyltransferase n=1 Tax=Owenweeksia hongkongensis (strain DSM 17368 / CIP 108786 / JCM 12287 / NRRL B-23963 / UST20020801) TaxID=926562 RepID=G8R4V0_OWEHD|nr:glycosyltransferase [Owenweeksia hongkongensis]AEV34264.1 glycosyltransferase [Owenweeksia hongkongensis DSM 17368]